MTEPLVAGIVNLTEDTAYRLLEHEATSGVIDNWRVTGLVTFVANTSTQAVCFRTPEGREWTGLMGDILEAFYGKGFRGIYPNDVNRFFEQLCAYTASRPELIDR
jgi:hypothetical protein